MLDTERIIREAVARLDASPVILAASFEISTRLCHKLGSEGLIAGYIAERAPEEEEDQDPLIWGWWNDWAQHGSWFFRRCIGSTLVFLSPSNQQEISSQMLVEASVKGIRSIVVVPIGGTPEKRFDVQAELLSR